MKKTIKYLMLSAVISLLLLSCESSKRFTSELSPAKKGYKGQSWNSLSKRMEKYDSFSEGIVNRAESYLGTPYCYGGNQEECFDCSGFVQKVFLSEGIVLPRTSSEQYAGSMPVPESQRSPGDLVFFSKGNRINHVGIYIGNDYFIHASTTKGVVRQSIFDEYYKKNFAGYGRVSRTDEDKDYSLRIFNEF